MASRCFLVLIAVAVALVPFAMARQNPSEVSLKDETYEPEGLPNGLLPPIALPVQLPPFPDCIPKILPDGSQGEEGYQTSGLIFCPPPPPAATPPIVPPTPTPPPPPTPASVPVPSP